MYLVIFYCVFLTALFIIPSFITYKRTGINPFQFSKEETAINFVGKAYKLISLVAFIPICINAFLPKWMSYLLPIEYLQIKNLVWLGFALLHISFIWIFIAQRNMANEWRIGIDNKNKVNLITKGLFSISRNPIFLGVLLVFVGLFLIIPNIVTAIVLISSFLVIQIQVRLEEEFLQNKIGDEYIAYIRSVKRWLV